ncbi:unnamed protein product [Cylicostephanus goldi]|uniref:Major facilitator superfamily (MFS) profile domain-containing protein n=1 Tax=Cylicostephanus goldi TaxID=71465 RepID=A0A3P6R2A6_CYLGO|nr:unnamed protein product [Cylicostephanus goldi]
MSLADFNGEDLNLCLHILVAYGISALIRYSPLSLPHGRPKCPSSGDPALNQRKPVQHIRHSSILGLFSTSLSIGALLGCVMVTPILNRCGVKSALMLFNNIILQIAPKQIKGSLSCFLHIAVCFGSAIGAILSLDFMLGGESTWGYLLLAPGILKHTKI